jgi:hypothetical protein
MTWELVLQIVILAVVATFLCIAALHSLMDKSYEDDLRRKKEGLL